MSYFVVPSVSYQTKQKLEKQQKEKERRAKRKKKHGSSGSDSTRSSAGSKHSQDTLGELPDNDDNKSIMTTASSLSKHTSHPGTSRSNSGFKPMSQLKEDQGPTPPSPKLPQQRDASPHVTRKPNEIPKVVEPEPSRPPDFNQSAQSRPVEQHLPKDSETEINDQASIIASKYGEALRSGPVKSPSTPPGHTFSKSPPAGRHRSGSVISSASVPSGHFSHNQAFQRNASISSGLSQTSQGSAPLSVKDNTSSNQKFRKLSFLGNSGKRRGSLASLPGTGGSPGSTNKQEGSYFPDYASGTTSPAQVSSSQPTSSALTITYDTSEAVPPPPMKILPPYQANIDLTIYNTREGLESFFVAPHYQVFRYNSFLDLLSEHHSTDAISISSIRYHLLLKFISKQKNAKEFLKQGNKLTFGSSYGLTMAEGVLAYHLYGPMRGVLRDLIKIRTANEHWHNHEELVQCNFINFVRYIATLPDNVNVADLNDIEKRIYQFKDVFSRTANAMYLLKKEQSSDSSSGDIAQLRIKLLIESITKVSYEYLLLEKYTLDIATKYHNNHLIDARLLKRLFHRYENNVKARNRDNVKVFIYNANNLIQFAWYVALTMPFMRIIESHVYTEDRTLLEDLNQYRQVEVDTPKVDFAASDQELFDTYIKKLSFASYSEYDNMTMDKLVKLHRSIDNQSPKYSRINRHEMPDPATNYSFRPMNFEYYNMPLATLPSNSFDLILNPDLVLQSTQKTYKTLVSEFHRILKPGGSLTIDTLQFGAKNTQEFLKMYQDGRFPEAFEDENFGVLKYFEGIPNFVETILRELSAVFGKGNVQFNISLLSSFLDVNSFTIKFVGMRLFETLGKFDDYCDSFTDATESFRPDAKESIHFSVHIRALKSI
ncbi:hypothetical protein Cantr_02103 [Candida viswanathii]|uniref:Uncharacterized protein n=1 Tax=Candida viswanathii TaxID=5486 RepID=A0A367YKN5_9ASCO|nr:hypothetical protein Cantr_02103 [Candida viswanathii]